MRKAKWYGASIILCAVGAWVGWYICRDSPIPTIPLTKVARLTDLSALLSNIQGRLTASADEVGIVHPADPYASRSETAVRLPESGTYLYPHQSELFELSKSKAGYQIVQRISVDAYGFSKEKYTVEDCLLLNSQNTIWFEIGQKDQLSQWLVEQQWGKPDRPFIVYPTGEFQSYTVDLVHRRVFLLRPNSPRLAVYDLTEKKVLSEYPLRKRIYWSSPVYEDSSDRIVVECPTLTGGSRIDSLDLKTGQWTGIGKGRDIALGPDHTILFISGNKLVQYRPETGESEVVYAAPSRSDDIWVLVGDDPAYLCFGYSGREKKPFDRYQVYIDLRRKEFQLTKYDAKESFSRARSTQGGKSGMDPWDEGLWKPVEEVNNDFIIEIKQVKP